jgi:hypothetical protein
MKAVRHIALAAIVALPISLSAKGVTTRITITGGSLAAAIDITDPVVLESFQIWAGPGTYAGGTEGREGLIVNWIAGAIERPPTAARYEVSFYVTPKRSSPRPEEQPAYVVYYDRDRDGLGYVYLPGRTDRWYEVNTRTILRGAGREGSWFHSTARWNSVVAPLLERFERYERSERR